MSQLGFDPDALREKYREERDRRLRDDGNEQYIEVAGQFARYLDDPYVAPVERGPLHDTVDVAVIGGGFSGLGGSPDVMAFCSALCARAPASRMERTRRMRLSLVSRVPEDRVRAVRK
jgi:hypothetical protein